MFETDHERTRVKICCISSLEEARLAIRLGASALGLASAMPSGPGVIPEERIAEIAHATPPGVATFLLTSLHEATDIAEQMRRCGASTVQICDRPALGAHERLRELLPGVSLVQVVHVLGEESLADALGFAPCVDALLLDSGDPFAAQKELGGTGRKHDWTVSARIVHETSLPVFLAGGLSADNVAAAIECVRPYGVDLCSGVRTADELDERKLREFMAAVAGAA